jgi:HK97 family phage portal protein
LKILNFEIKKASSKSTSIIPMSMYNNGLAQPPKATLEQFLRAYGEIGWLHAVVALAARSVAEVNGHLNRVVDGDTVEVTGPHPLKELLNSPNDYQTGHDLTEITQIYEELTGEGYWHLGYENGKQTLWSFPPHKIKVVTSKEEFISGYVFSGPDGDTPLNKEDVIPFISPNPLMPWRGVGPAQAIALELDTQAYANQTNRYFFYNGATMGIMISYPQDIPPEEYARIKEQFQADHRGYGQSHKAVILSGGATIVDPNQKFGARDMDFVNMLKNGRDMILGAYGTSYSMLGGSEHVNRATAEAAQVDYASRVIRPRLQKRRDKINKFLVPKFVDTTVPKGAYELQRALRKSYGYTTAGADARVMELKDLLNIDGDLTGNQDNMSKVWKAVGESTTLQYDFDNPVPEDTVNQALMVDNAVKAGRMSLEEARSLSDMGAIDPEEHFMIASGFTVATGQQIIDGEIPKPQPVVPQGSINSDDTAKKHIKALLIDEMEETFWDNHPKLKEEYHK